MPILINIIESLLFLFVMLAPIPLIRWARNRLLNCADEKSFPEGIKLFVAFFLWFVLQAFIAHLLGWTGLLNRFSLLAIHVLVFTAGLYLNKEPFKLPEPPEDYKIPLLIVAFLFIVLFFQVLGNPTTDFDSLCYHQPTMANWQQDGRFSVLHILDYQTMQSISPEPNTGQVARYPFGWEATCMTALLPFGDDVMISFLNLVCWLLLGLTLFVISQQFGAERNAATLASLLGMLFPLVLKHIGTMNVDLPFAVFFLAGLVSAKQFSKTPQPIFLFSFIASISLLFAIKLSAIPYSAVLVVFFIFQLVAEQRGNIKQALCIKNQFIALLTGFIFFLITGASWYLRNWIELGNPFGYLVVESFGLKIFDGELESKQLTVTALKNVFDVTELQHWKTFFKQFWVQFQLPMLLLGLGAFGILKVFISKDIEIKKSQIIVLFAVAAACFYFYWSNPYTADNNTATPQITPWLGQQMRFAFAFAFLIAPIAAIGMTILNLPKNFLICFAGFIWLVSIIAFYKQYHGQMDALFLILMYHSIVIEKRKPGKIAKVTICIATICIVIIHIITAVHAREKNRETNYDSIYVYMKKNVPADSTVAYFRSPVSYFFYDRDLKRKIVFGAEHVETNEEWLRELRDKNCEYIVVGPLSKEFIEFVPAAQAINDGEMPFEKIHGDGIEKSYTLFKIIYAD